MDYSKNKGCLLYILVLFLSIGCKHSITPISHIYYYQQPIYDQYALEVKNDTLQFLLTDTTYNQIKSFNLFNDKGINYISFYDQRSQSINIYYQIDQRLCKTILLKNLFNSRQLYKTSVYIKNWDSIFIINKSTLRLFDSSGHRKLKIDFPSEPKKNAAVFDNNKLPVLLDNQLFAISRNRVDEESLNALRTWKVMYSFDLKKGTCQLLYPLPVHYQENLYGKQFLDYNFCYNQQRGKFVFSFPADTLLYETDFANYHHSYFARSQRHQTPIQPASKLALEDYQLSKKEYVTQYSYGSVFYDPIKKYYLRHVKHSLSPQEFEDKERQPQSVLIFNENLQIIGESEWPADTDFDSIFATPDGHLYARTNFSNESAIQFVRLTYRDKFRPAPLASNNTPQK